MRKPGRRGRDIRESAVRRREFLQAHERLQVRKRLLQGAGLSFASAGGMPEGLGQGVNLAEPGIAGHQHFRAQPPYSLNNQRP